MNARPIALVGPRGAGKSTVGRALASLLGRTFVDLDDEVVRLAADPAHRTAGAVLRARGEEAFRALEERALEALLSDPGPIVLATGGGVVESRAARRRLRAATLCVHLEATDEVRAARLAADPTERPGLGTPDALLATVREPYYRAAAELAVDADGRVDAVVRALALIVAAEERKVRADGANGADESR